MSVSRMVLPGSEQDDRRGGLDPLDDAEPTSAGVVDLQRHAAGRADANNVPVDRRRAS